MFDQVAAQFRSRSDLLMSGRFEMLAAQYVYPLPVFLEDSRIVIRTVDDAIAILCLLRAALLERSVVSLQPRVTAIGMPRAGRFRVWVDWHEVSVPADGVRKSSATYYCRQTANGLQTEMVNYSDLSMPELNSHLAALALSA